MTLAAYDDFVRGGAQVTAPIMAATAWRTNGHMIADVARLGYIRDADLVLDPTYGRGGWWTQYRPSRLIGHDLDPKLSPNGDSIDFRALPYITGLFDAVAFDPPYKLNGTPTVAVDQRYGVHAVASREDRHRLIREGTVECLRVLKRGGFLLLKCQDQVNGGKVRWQTMDFAWHAGLYGGRLVDMLHMLGGRPQPEGTSQRHARRNMSTLLVLRKEFA